MIDAVSLVAVEYVYFSPLVLCLYIVEISIEENIVMFVCYSTKKKHTSKITMNLFVFKVPEDFLLHIELLFIIYSSSNEL